MFIFIYLKAFRAIHLQQLGKKGDCFPYLLPSIGPRADMGVEVVHRRWL